jgi:hypothetical protein
MAIKILKTPYPHDILVSPRRAEQNNLKMFSKTLYLAFHLGTSSFLTRRPRRNLTVAQTSHGYSFVVGSIRVKLSIN